MTWAQVDMSGMLVAWVRSCAGVGAAPEVASRSNHDALVRDPDHNDKGSEPASHVAAAGAG